MSSVPCLPLQLVLFPLEKRCPRCGLTRPYKSFLEHTRTKSGWCRDCFNAYNCERRRRVRARRKAARIAAREAATEKLCRRCGRVLPLEGFAQRRAIPTGRVAHCRDCHRLYRAAHAARISAVKKRWQLLNRERLRHQHRAHYLATRERQKEYRRLYYARTADAAKARAKEWMHAHPLARRAIVQRRRAHLRGAEGRYTVHDIRMLYEGQRGCCAYCGLSLNGVFEVDHVMPLSRGGSNWPRNLALACAACNRLKNALTGDEFRARLSRRL